MKRIAIRTASETLRGIGQIVLQDNARSGLLILAGLLCTAPRYALGALAGSLFGACCARLLHCPEEEIRSGLYGFNAALVGIAGAVFLRDGAAQAVLTALGALLTVVAMRSALRRGFPAYTAPFVAATWLLLGLAACCPALAAPAGGTAAEAGWLDICARHFAQIFLADAPLTGLLVLAALAVHTRTGALCALWGCLLAAGVVWLLPVDGADAAAGLYGYNAVLCALAVGDATPAGMLRATAAALLSTALQAGALAAGLPSLTAPFVVSVWAVLLFDRIRDARKSA